MRNKKTVSILLHLSSGKKIKAVVDADCYDDAIEEWIRGKDRVNFNNCCVNAKDIIGIEYK